MFKMRVLCCTCLLIVAAVPLSAQTIDATSGWVWQNPWPQGNNLSSVFLLDSRNIFAVGDNGRFMRSSDGGATWTVNSLEIDALHSVSCSDVNTCTAVGVSGSAVVYQTKDGGNTWAAAQTIGGTSGYPARMSCTDANTCTVTYGSQVVRTTDGWVTWTSQTPAPANVTLFGISCTDFNTCTVAAGRLSQDGYILRTTDGGSTWNTVYTALGQGNVAAISCTDNTTCTALEAYGILRSTDGGSTWAFSYFSSNPLLSIFCSDVNTCTAVGNGQIVQTFDGGSTWNQQPSGLTPDLDSTTVACAGPNTCVATGKQGSLLQTTDGTDWSRLDRAATRGGIEAVSCVNANTCTAVGPIGSIVRTSNAGFTWTPQPIPTTLSLSAISCTDDNTCTAVGGYNTGGTTIAGILRTTDGGNTWTQQQQSTGTPRPLVAVSCTDPNTCTAAGFGCGTTCSAMIIQTADGGTTWTQTWELASNAVSLRSISCATSSTCTAAGFDNRFGNYANPLIVNTTDGGTTWIQQPAPGGGLSGISCPDVNTCIAVGTTGVLRTTDGGATWTVADSRAFFSYVSCLDANTCTALEDGEGSGPSPVAHTNDGGITWTFQSSNETVPLAGVSCIDANTCTAVGTRGTILRTISSPQSAGAAFDNAMSSGFQWSATTASTPTFVVGNGANRAAMIMVAMSANNATGITASLGGVSGALVPGTDSGTSASTRTLIYGVVNPPSGSQTATVSWTGTMNADVGAITVSGADQTTPCTSGTFAATDSAPSQTTSVTITSNPGDLTASFGYTDDSWASPPTNQTLKWGVDSGAVGGDIGPGTGTTVHSWTDQYFYETQSDSGANFKAASR